MILKYGNDRVLGNNCISKDFWFTELHIRLFLVQNGRPNSTKQKHSQRNESVRSKFKKRRLGYQYGWFFAPIVLVYFHPGCYKLNPFSHCYRAGAGPNIYIYKYLLYKNKFYIINLLYFWIF